MSIFQRFLSWLLQFKRRQVPAKKKKVFLTLGTKSRADMKYNKLISKFKRRHKRNPTRNEKFMMVVNASHHTIRYRRGHSSHWERQKVRKYLFEKHKIVGNWRIR